VDRNGADHQLLAGRYELGARLGHGGMGDVRAAYDHRLARPVAVKFLSAGLAEQPSARRRFEIEARAAARLVHPHVVTVFDTGDDGVPFLVMERLPGRTWRDEFVADGLPVDRVCQIGIEILSALQAAHDAGVIHRDIKPGNVLLTEDGHAEVADFGIAKTTEDLDQTLTGELLATPPYLAPERFAGQAATPASDIYSVGVVLYEALTGRRPFAGDTPMAVLHAIERGRPEPLGELRPDLPSFLVAAVERDVDEPKPTRTLVSAVAPVRAGQRRRRTVVVGLGVSLVAALAVGIAVAQNGADDPPEPAVEVATTAPVAESSTGGGPLPAPLDRSLRELERSITP
jgi:eukaryotic-like serine/threonine-protein kinase